MTWSLVADQEYMTIFNRFESREEDGVIDWQEFLAYYQTSRATLRAVCVCVSLCAILHSCAHYNGWRSVSLICCAGCTLLVLDRQSKSRLPLYHALASLQESWGTIQEALERQRRTQGLPSIPEDEGHSLNCLIFSTLSTQAVPQNVKTLRALCPSLQINQELLRRISVIFKSVHDSVVVFVQNLLMSHTVDICACARVSVGVCCVFDTCSVKTSMPSWISCAASSEASSSTAIYGAPATTSWRTFDTSS